MENPDWSHSIGQNIDSNDVAGEPGDDFESRVTPVVGHTGEQHHCLKEYNCKYIDSFKRGVDVAYLPVTTRVDILSNQPWDRSWQ